MPRVFTTMSGPPTEIPQLRKCLLRKALLTPCGSQVLAGFEADQPRFWGTPGVARAQSTTRKALRMPIRGGLQYLPQQLWPEQSLAAAACAGSVARLHYHQRSCRQQAPAASLAPIAAEAAPAA